MTRLTRSSHVLDLIPDLVLGLLPGDDEQRVAAHLSRCGECRQALSEEEAIGRTVKVTLARTSTVDRHTLRRLAPDASAPAKARLRRPLWSPGLAAAALMVLLLFGAAALFAGQQSGAWSLSAPTARSTLVLLTDTPTQTVTREMTATAAGLEEANSGPAPARRSLVSGQAARPLPAVVPVPAAPIMQ